MASPRPMWRQAFDAVEEPVRKRVEAIAGTAEFARALMIAFQAWSTVGQTTRNASTRLLHLANLPAHSDLRRLSRQLGTLENRVAKLGGELERITTLLDGADPKARKPRA